MTKFPEYESFDALGLANLVQRGVMAPAEILEAAIERVELYNPPINAVIYKMYDEAFDYLKTYRPEGLFQGVPFLLKDLIAESAGSPLSSGSRFTQHFISQQNSEIVNRFKKAGLIIFGKTNTPEFGISPVTEPALFGPTHNPWDLTRSPGGSSGGSAAAIASGMVPMAHGGDGAGSIRIPAAYCGLFGLKPSRGRTPVGPRVLRIWQGMVVEHVLTRSVRDSAAMLDCIAGPELGSPIALPKPERSFLNYLDQPPRKLQIAVIEEPFFKTTVNEEYLDALEGAGILCQDLGHYVEEISLSINSEEVALAFLIVVAAEIAAAVKLFAKFIGHKPHHRDLESATAILCQVGEHFSAPDLIWANHTLDQVSRSLAHLFEDYDVLITPTMAGPPPQIGQLKLDRIEKSLLEILRRVPYGPVLRKLVKSIASKQLSFTPYTPLYNICGQPAMSVPLYWDKQGLPIGIQFAGFIGGEGILFQLASQLEKARPWGNIRPTMGKPS